MIKEELDNVIEEIEDNIMSEIKIDKKNFISYGIKKLKEDIIFIDGGNCNIFLSPNISVDVIRIAIIEYPNAENHEREYYKGRKKRTLKEFLCLSKKDGDKWKVKIFPKENDYTIERKIEDVNDIGNYVRHFLELYITRKYTKDSIKKHTKTSKAIIILDGLLKVNNIEEKDILKSLIEECITVGLAKTSQLTINNNSASVVIERAAGSLGKKQFIYFLKEEDDKNIFLAKLDSRSSYIFRIEIPNKYKKDKLERIFSCLINNSDDASFYGYPYGLIEADRFARISSREKEYYRMLFMIKAKELAKELEKEEHSLNAHSVIDNLWY